MTKDIISEVYNMDCIAGMKEYPDKYFDLAIVDPPYGINIAKNGTVGGNNLSKSKDYGAKSWDNEPPKVEYFLELFRVSKNQIIWGGNYFDLPPTQNYIIWDKVQPFDFTSAMAELAWCSIQMPIKIFKKHVVTAEPNKIHPTQKPVDLYKFLINKYLIEKMGGGKILDTHVGSGSIAIACHDYGVELTGCEIDEKYYQDTVKRIQNHTSQLKLF